MRHIVWFRTLLILLFVMLASIFQMEAQRVVVKTNGLLWLTASPNIGFEFRANDNWTVEFSLAGNPIATEALKTQFFTFQPEVRYWFFRPLSGWFIGPSAYYTLYDLKYNAFSRQGDVFALGASAGYAWVLSNHWNIEVNLGVGAALNRIAPEDIYQPLEYQWLPVPMKCAVSISYIIK